MTNEQHIHNVLLKKFEDVREHRIMVGDVRVRVWRGIKWASDETTSEFGGSLIMSVLGTSVHPVQQNQPFLTSSKLDRVTFEELEKGRTIGTGWTGCRDNDRKEFLSIVKGIGSVDFDMFAKLSIQHNICKTDIEADALIKQLVTNGDLMEVKPGEYHAT